MTDQDREAFELYAKENRLFLSGIKNTDGTYQGEFTQQAWRVWQTCAARYAPKLTEAQAIEAACNAYANQQSKMGYGYYPVEVGSANHESLLAVIAALRAAGVRFKEEA